MNVVTLPTIGERSTASSVSVCVCVCVCVCLRNDTSDLYQLFVRVTHGRGSVLVA